MGQCHHIWRLMFRTKKGLYHNFLFLCRSSAMMRRWQKALREGVTGWRAVVFKMDESPVFEELNVAWAGHELVSDYTDTVLDWFTNSLDGPKLMTAVNPRLD